MQNGGALAPPFPWADVYFLARLLVVAFSPVPASPLALALLRELVLLPVPALLPAPALLDAASAPAFFSTGRPFPVSDTV